MDQRDVLKVGLHFKKLPAGTVCPLCRRSSPHSAGKSGEGDWTIVGLVAAPVFSDGGATALAHVHVRCDLCAFIMVFSADALGIKVE